MALRYLSNINLNGNQLIGASIEPKSTAPTEYLVAGRAYYNTASDKLFVHTGSAFVQVGTTYSTSVVDQTGIRLRLTGNNATTDDVIFDGAGGLAVSAFTPPDVNGVAQPTRIRTTLSDVSGLNDVNTAIGSATIVPVITYNAKGQITGTTTATISGTLTVNADSGTQDASLISDDLEILGTTNQITTAVTRGSSPNTDKVKVTIGLPDDVTITGNLTVSGTTTTLNTATLDVEDLNVTVGKNATTTSAADGAGLTFGAWSSGTTPTFTWVNSTSKLTANKPLQATSFHGNLTGNVTGEVSTLSNHFHKVALAASESSVTKTGNTYTVTHNLGTRDVLVQVTRVASPFDTVYVDVERLLTSTVKISFAAAVTDGDYKVLVFRLA